jgi:hypothetical protein
MRPELVKGPLGICVTLKGIWYEGLPPLLGESRMGLGSPHKGTEELPPLPHSPKGQRTTPRRYIAYL